MGRGGTGAGGARRDVIGIGGGTRLRARRRTPVLDAGGAARDEGEVRRSRLMGDRGAVGEDDEAAVEEFADFETALRP